jgi:hypothetical protein
LIVVSLTHFLPPSQFWLPNLLLIRRLDLRAAAVQLAALSLKKEWNLNSRNAPTDLKNHSQNCMKTMTNFEKLPQQNNKTNPCCLFFWFICWLKTLPYLQYIQEQVLGSWQQEPKQTARKNSRGSPCKILNFPVLPSHYYFGDSIWLDLVDPNILLWYPLHYNDYPHGTIQNSQTHPGNVILQEPGNCLEIALQQHGCQSILDVIALTPWEIETLQSWTDDSKPKRTLGPGPWCQAIHLQAFVLSLHPSPILMTPMIG